MVVFGALLCAVLLFAGARAACDEESHWDAVFRTQPGRYDVGCLGQNLETDCCVHEDRLVTWQERLDNTTQWRDLEPAHATVLDNGQRLLLLNRREPELQVRCTVQGTDRSVIKQILYTTCDSCRPGKFTYPPDENTSINVLQGSRISFTFQLFVGCSDQKEALTTIGLFRSRRSPFGYSPLDSLDRHNVTYLMKGGSIKIRVTIDKVKEEDYAYVYIASNSRVRRMYRLVERMPVDFAVEKPEEPLVIAPFAVPLLLPCIIALLYVYRLNLRSFFRSFLHAEADARVLFINSSAPDDVQYMEVHLLPILVSELGLDVQTNYRNFLVGGNDDEQFSEEVALCSRIIILLSNNFLKEYICNRAFELANISDNSKIVFICTEGLSDWDDEVHSVLKKRLEVAGRFYSPCRKLVCPCEGASPGSGLLAALKNFKHRRDVDSFKKRLRLAMPLTEFGSRRFRGFEVTSPLEKWNRAYGRQASTASDVVLHV